MQAWHTSTTRNAAAVSVKREASSIQTITCVQGLSTPIVTLTLDLTLPLSVRLQVSAVHVTDNMQYPRLESFKRVALTDSDGCSRFNDLVIIVRRRIRSRTVVDAAAVVTVCHTVQVIRVGDGRGRLRSTAATTRSRCWRGHAVARRRACRIAQVLRDGVRRASLKLGVRVRASPGASNASPSDDERSAPVLVWQSCTRDRQRNVLEYAAP